MRRLIMAATSSRSARCPSAGPAVAPRGPLPLSGRHRRLDRFDIPTRTRLLRSTQPSNCYSTAVLLAFSFAHGAVVLVETKLHRIEGQDCPIPIPKIYMTGSHVSSYYRYSSHEMEILRRVSQKSLLRQEILQRRIKFSPIRAISVISTMTSKGWVLGP